MSYGLLVISVFLPLLHDCQHCDLSSRKTAIIVWCQNRAVPFLWIIGVSENLESRADVGANNWSPCQSCFSNGQWQSFRYRGIHKHPRVFQDCFWISVTFQSH